MWKTDVLLMRTHKTIAQEVARKVQLHGPAGEQINSL